ncbi:hypothetical protein SDC9_192483 [bioreactor metagenome]|uniref:Uncharacterized protein n=1 Tax=bioreactor metagenome TaxID=1076179 RepID=A0A645I239_9ZZZZ
MLCERKSGDRDAHDLCFYRAASLFKEIERHECRVVKLSETLPKRSRGQAACLRQCLEPAYKFRVVIYGGGGPRSAEVRETSRRACAGRDVEIIAVDGGVRRDDDQRLRRGAGDERSGPFVRRGGL